MDFVFVAACPKNSFTGAYNVEVKTITDIRAACSAGITVFHSAGHKIKIPQLFMIIFKTMIMDIPNGGIDSLHDFSCCLLLNRYIGVAEGSLFCGNMPVSLQG